MSSYNRSCNCFISHNLCRIPGCGCCSIIAHTWHIDSSCPNNIIYRLPGLWTMNFNFINFYFFKYIYHTNMVILFIWLYYCILLWLCEFLGVYEIDKKEFYKLCNYFQWLVSLTLQDANVNHCKKLVRLHLGSCSPGFVIYRDIKQAKSQTEHIIRNVITLMLLVPGLVDFGEVIEDLAVPVSKLLL